MVRALVLLFYVKLARGHRVNLITGDSKPSRCRQCPRICMRYQMGSNANHREIARDRNS